MTRIIGWVGSSFLTGALALATSGASAPQTRAPQAPPAPRQQQCSPAGYEALFDDLQGELARADLELAIDDSARAIDAGALALDAVQDGFEFQDDGSVHVFSSHDGSPWLGIRMEEVTPSKAKELNLPAERGALITAVSDDSPASKAGIKVGDVITDFDGQRIEGTLTLQRLVREIPAGRKVSLSLWRDGHSQSLTVELASRHAFHNGDRDRFFVETPGMHFEMPPIPPMPSIEVGPFSTFRAFGSPALGIDAEELSGQLGNFFGAPDGEGILVREVMPGLPAEKAGLKAGDVIIRVDGKRVKDLSELRSALREKLSKSQEEVESGKTATPAADLTILRSGKESTVRVELQAPMRRTRPARRVAV